MLLLPLFIISAAASAVVAADTAGATDTTNTNTNKNKNTTIGGDVVGCERLKQRNAVTGMGDTLQKPPSREFWIQLRDAYVSSVGEVESTIDWTTPSSSSMSEDDSSGTTEHLSGFMIPYEVKISPGKGRSVHTKQFVPKGAPVWNPKYSGYLYNQEDFEIFLTKLTWEQSCDVLQWCYAVRYKDDEGSGGNDNFGVGCDLDEAAMINHAERASGEANTYYDSERDAIVAVKDLQAGDELLQDYNDFEEHLEWLDNLAHKAWGIDTSSQPGHPSAECAKTTAGEL